MIVITGGAGFIGSALAWQCNCRGREDILLVDHLDESEKWKNLVSLRFLDYLDRDEFLCRLENNDFGKSIDALFHLGACSSTTEANTSYLMENNYRYTQRLAQWHALHHRCRFIYASSAATYGSGDGGYGDSHERLDALRPLNMYGYSKHLFDRYAARNNLLTTMVGLKFFNVFGPNEYHKRDMRSVVNKAFPAVRDTGHIKLFKSHRPDYRDGEQKRDFIYVKDAVAMTLFFLDHPDVNGLYNIGTGQARTWNEVASALFTALKKTPRITYIPMPLELRDKYQYFTCADTTRLRAAGCTHRCMSLDEAVLDYVTNYLVPGRHLDPQHQS